MGGVGDFLFGSKPEQKSTSTSQSGNYAYPYMLGAYGPAMGYTTAAGNMMGNLLGLWNGGGSTGGPSTPTPAPIPTTPNPALEGSGFDGGVRGAITRRRIAQGKKPGAEPDFPAGPSPLPVPGTQTPAPTTGTGSQSSALENWANSGGMKFIMDQGVKALEGSAAGKGMLQSGATGQALMKYGQGLGSTYLNQYMDQLYKQAQLGIQAGGLVGSTGGWSKGTGTSSGEGGKQGALPGIISSVASIPGVSDIRMKKNIEYVGTNEQGLKIYEFEFVDPELPVGRHRGPMAHEVKEVLPKAFIPNFWKGYDGVDYAQVKGL